MLDNKKGQMTLQQAPALVILLVVVGIVGAIGVLIVTDVGATLTGDAASVIGNITESILNFFSLTPVLGTIFIAVILLAAVGYLAFSYSANQ